jgi:hypothetical protein
VNGAPGKVIERRGDEPPRRPCEDRSWASAHPLADVRHDPRGYIGRWCVLAASEDEAAGSQTSIPCSRNTLSK